LGSILFLWDDALTFQHFEKFHESESTPTGSHICHQEMKGYTLKPIGITQLQGYSSQERI
jgi:hypothetical protein